MPHASTCMSRTVAMRRLRTNSTAVLLSRPRVELSYSATFARVESSSAILTRFFSPPEMPRMSSLPTLVLKVWRRPRIVPSASRARPR